MPLIDTQNKILASKPGRIILGILVVAIVALGFVAVFQSSYDVHSRLIVIPETDDRLINYRLTSKEQFEKYTVKIDQFLDTYKSENFNVYQCSYDNPPKEGQVCHVDVDKFGPCVRENYYNYHKGGPCVFLKLQKTPSWEPTFYNASTVPEQMPEYLKSYVSNDINQDKKAVWVSCEGENDVDKENIGPMSYFPSSGFPSYYFPYKNQQGYLEPLIAVHFERPTLGVVIFVKCRLWAQDSNDFASFSLYIQ